MGKRSFGRRKKALVHLSPVFDLGAVQALCGARRSKYEPRESNPALVTCAECRVMMDFVLEKDLAFIIETRQGQPIFTMADKYLHVRVDPVKTATDAMLEAGALRMMRQITQDVALNVYNDALDALVYGMRNIPADEHVQETDPAGEDPRRS